MGWFSDFGDGISSSFGTLPEWCKSIGKIALWLSIFAFMVVNIGEVTYDIIFRSLPVTAEDVHAAERKAEFERHRAEAIYSPRIASAQADAQVEIELAKAEANRALLGLPKKIQVSSNSPTFVFEIATAHLPTILVIMLAIYLLPTFSSTGDPWRLVINIAAVIVLSGLFALVRGINFPSTVEAKSSAGSIDITSTLVGLCLMLFGTVIAGYSLHMYNKYKNQSAHE